MTIQTTWRGPKPNAFTIPAKSSILPLLPKCKINHQKNMTPIVLKGSSKFPQPEMMWKKND